jgi:hypothetical protein
MVAVIPSRHQAELIGPYGYGDFHTVITPEDCAPPSDKMADILPATVWAVLRGKVSTPVR